MCRTDQNSVFCCIPEMIQAVKNSDLFHSRLRQIWNRTCDMAFLPLSSEAYLEQNLRYGVPFTLVRGKSGIEPAIWRSFHSRLRHIWNRTYRVPTQEVRGLGDERPTAGKLLSACRYKTGTTRPQKILVFKIAHICSTSDSQSCE